MCPYDKNLIWLLVNNNIPIVLHFNRSDPEIYIYISKQVGINVINPILKKKSYSNIICNNSQQLKMRSHKYAIITHYCRNHDTDLNIVIVKKPNRITTLNFNQTDSDQFFGIKNGKLKKYTEKNCHVIIQTYLL